MQNSQRQQVDKNGRGRQGRKNNSGRDSGSQNLRHTALDLLARREHSRKELEQKLVQKLSVDGDRSNILSLLDQLAEQGLLSDERFTEAYISMRARKGYGPERIAKELSEKGVEMELVSRYLKDGIDWQDLLKKTWRKKFNRPPLDYKDKARQMRFLHYRGYKTDAISCLFDSLD